MKAVLIVMMFVGTPDELNTATEIGNMFKCHELAEELRQATNGTGIRYVCLPLKTRARFPGIPEYSLDHIPDGPMPISE